MKAAIQTFGATPVTALAANSMFDYMSGGIVDGAVTGKGSLISFQLARYIKYITLFPGPARLQRFSLLHEREEI